MQAVAINPSLVVCESLSNDIGTSNLVVKRMIDGSLPFSANICINIVHIKCIADLHVQAMKDDRAVGKRFIASTKHIWLPELTKLLRNNGYNAPKFNLTAPLLKLFYLYSKQEKLLSNDNNNVVAVIGDGAMSAGMAYEAMNNAGAMKSKLIVILNDNDMSIARPVGAMSLSLIHI